MKHVIVRETSSEIRAIARGALRGHWAMVFAAVVVYYAMTVVVTNLLAVLMPSASYTVFNEYLGQHLTVSYVSSLYSFVLTGAFEVGLCSFLLAFFRQKDTNPAHIFDGFEVFLKSFALMFMQSLFIFLWSLLFVIPGIIAAFRYSQAYFILADNPEKSVMECIRESKIIMTGNKGKLFFLSLSFFGWAFLAAIPVALFPPVSGVMGVLLDFVCMLPGLLVTAYSSTAQVVLFDLATGRLVSRESAFREEDYHF